MNKYILRALWFWGLPLGPCVLLAIFSETLEPMTKHWLLVTIFALNALVNFAAYRGALQCFRVNDFFPEEKKNLKISCIVSSIGSVLLVIFWIARK